MDPEAGLLLIDKPAGMTSHGAVQVVRRRIGIRRVGHTGTLDPFATGLLLMCTGRFTRAVEYFHALTKTYEAEMRLGVETDTHDATGTVREEGQMTGLDANEVERVVSGLEGESIQRPPAISAKRVGGRRAHAEARAGRVPSLDPVPITVHAVRVASIDLPLVRFSATVSTGTYVRALARDVGRALGCGAHLSALRRTAIGPFRVEDARGPDDPELGVAGKRVVLTPAEALVWMPRHDVGPIQSEALRHGRALTLDSESPGLGCPEGPVSVFQDGRLVAIGVVADGELRPRKVLS